MLLLNEQEIMEKSLAVQNQMTFKEFISFNNIDLDSILVDKIFHNIRNDLPIYMDESMVEYFGYSGIMIHQRESIKKLIENNFIEYQNQLWYSYQNKEYVKFCEKTNKSLESHQTDSKNNEEKSEISLLYPPAPTGRGTSTTKHLLIMPKLFKEMLMLCQTDKGKQVRRYYIDMMEVMELYIKFQSRVQIKSLNNQLSDIKQILNRSEKRFEEESKKREEESKKREEEFNKLLGVATETKSSLDETREELKDTNTNLQKILPERVRISKVPTIKNHIFVVLEDTSDTDGFPYYALRRQEHSINDAIQKVKSKFPDVRIYLKIKHAGSIHFWNEVKVSHLKENIIHTSGNSNWFGIKDITCSDFKKEIKNLDKIKLNANE